MRCTVCFILSLLLPAVAAAQSTGKKAVPKNAGVIELTAPAGATVTVDGRNYKKQRKFTFEPLKANTVYTIDIRVRFKSGQQTVRKVTLEAGRHLRLSLRDPAVKMPQLVPQTGHAGSANYAAFSDDGKYLLTGSDKAILWDVNTGRVLRIYDGHSESLRGVGFAAGSTRVVTAAMDDRIIVWDRDSGRKLNVIDVETCYGASFSRDGFKAIVEGYKSADLWDLIAGRRLRTFKGGHSKGIGNVVYSQDGGQIATISSSKSDRLVILWNSSTGHQLHKLTGHRLDIDDATFSPDGKWLLTWSGKSDYKMKTSEGELILWNTQDGQQVARLALEQSISDASFRPDGKQILVKRFGYEDGEHYGELVFHETERLRQIRSLQDKSLGGLARYAPNGQHAFDGRQLWNVDNSIKLVSFAGHQSSLPSVAFSARGAEFLLGSNSGACRLIDLASGRTLRRFKSPFENGRLGKCLMSADGRRVIAIAHQPNSSASHIALYDATDGSLLRTIPVSAESINSVEANRAGTLLLTRSSEAVILWDSQSGRNLGRFGREKYNFGAALSPIGGRILTMPHNSESPAKYPYDVYNFGTLWDSKTGREIRTFKLSTRSKFSTVAGRRWHEFYSYRDFYVLSFAQNGRLAITAGEEHHHKFLSGDTSIDAKDRRPDTGIIFVWDVNAGKLKHTFRGHTEEIESVAFSRDGRRAISYADDNSLIVWDVRSGKKLFRSNAHTEDSTPPSLSPDGRQVLTLAGDGTIRLWDVDTGAEAMRMIRFRQEKDETKEEQEEDDWLVMTPDGLFDGTPEARRQVAFRIGDGLNVVPVERFYQDFYRPGLLAAITGDGGISPQLLLGQSLPPTLKITSNKNVSVVKQDVEIAVEATDQGGGISGLALFQNGARVLSKGEIRREGKKIFRTFQIGLVEGRNRIRIKAANADGSWESEPAQVELTYERPLARSELYVLAVGVNRYTEATMNLKFAAADATAMADLFKRRGTTLYEKVHVTKLLDKQVTKDGVQDALTAMAKKAKPQDSLLVFLAGHGTMVAQRYYFVTHDFQQQADRLETDIRKQCLPIDQLGDWIAAVPALKRLLIFDTCQSGGVIQVAGRARNPFAFRGAIERLGRSQGVFTIAASASTGDAQEIPELGHGVLTYSLLAGLRAVDAGPLVDKSVRPDNPEQVADVLGWFNFASSHVPRLTVKFLGSEQQVQTSGEGASFPVLPLDD